MKREKEKFSSKTCIVADRTSTDRSYKERRVNKSTPKKPKKTKTILHVSRLPFRNAYHRPSQRTPFTHSSILSYHFFPPRPRFNLQASALYPSPPQATPSLSILRKPIWSLARCNSPRHIQQQSIRSRTTSCSLAVDGPAQAPYRSRTCSGEMGDCISKPKMDGRRKCQSPSTVHEREIQLEASMLSYLVVQHGVPYTAAHSYGQSSAAGCQDEGPITETLVWRAIGRDVGSICYISRCPTFAYLS